MEKIVKINSDNIVEDVVLVSETDFLDQNGNFSSQVGIDFIKLLIENSEDYMFIHLDDSYNYQPALGWIYDSNKNIFIKDRRNFSHTQLYDENIGDWVYPVPMPEDGEPEGFMYIWDEDLYQSDNTKGWVLIKLPVD